MTVPTPGPATKTMPSSAPERPAAPPPDSSPATVPRSSTAATTVMPSVTSGSSPASLTTAALAQPSRGRSSHSTASVTRSPPGSPTSTASQHSPASASAAAFAAAAAQVPVVRPVRGSGSTALRRPPPARAAARSRWPRQGGFRRECPRSRRTPDRTRMSASFDSAASTKPTGMPITSAGRATPSAASVEHLAQRRRRVAERHHRAVQTRAEGAHRAGRARAAGALGLGGDRRDGDQTLDGAAVGRDPVLVHADAHHVRVGEHGRAGEQRRHPGLDGSGREAGGVRQRGSPLVCTRRFTTVSSPPDQSPAGSSPSMIAMLRDLDLVRLQSRHVASSARSARIAAMRTSAPAAGRSGRRYRGGPP